MRVQRRLSIDVPISSALPPSVVVAALQTFSPVIRHLGTLSRYEPIQPRAGVVADDPFFTPAAPDGDLAVSSFQVYELITLAPGLTKEVTYPTHFQRLPNGLRCRADGAARIVGWCEFTVRPRRNAGSDAAPSPDGSASTPSSINDADEYELHEAMVIEANSLLMPFVLQTMSVAHRGLCNKILDEVMQQYYAGFDYVQML